ncbi:hypothetical protein ACFIJ5_05615 [Haloimpatiens sp. FM7330]
MEVIVIRNGKLDINKLGTALSELINKTLEEKKKDNINKTNNSK